MIIISTRLAAGDRASWTVPQCTCETRIDGIRLSNQNTQQCCRHALLDRACGTQVREKGLMRFCNADSLTVRQQERAPFTRETQRENFSPKRRDCRGILSQQCSVVESMKPLCLFPWQMDRSSQMPWPGWSAREWGICRGLAANHWHW
jgi:hypothetical protein